MKEPRLQYSFLNWFQQAPCVFASLRGIEYLFAPVKSNENYYPTDMKKLTVSLLLLLLLLAGNAIAQDSVLLKALKKLPGIEIVGPTRHGQQYSEAYEIKFTQPVE
ncbi:MAG: hypothetical protein D4R64_15775 [Porphyromonadaceae bacterium]|nr:MAG: hypothetical protein D4R64_15775 [Porphyromonadaceae bacterium]